MGSFVFDSSSFILLTSIFGAAALISIRNAKGPEVHPLLLNTQSDVARLRQPHESAHYRSRMTPNGTLLLSTFDRNIHTLSDLYNMALEKHGAASFLGSFKDAGESWQTYEQVARQAKRVYGGLRSLTQLEPRSGNPSSFVGIYALNSAESMIVELACHLHGLVTIPITASAPGLHLEHVLRDSGLSVLFVGCSQVKSVLGSGIASLKHIVVFGDVDMSTVTEGRSKGVDIITFKELTENNGDHGKVEGLIGSDMASIYYDCFAEQKRGVILTHENLLSSISSYIKVIPPAKMITQMDRLMHNLPMDNVFGHVLSALFAFSGASIIFDHDTSYLDRATDITQALERTAKAKPTVYASVGPFLSDVKGLIERHYGSSFLFQRGVDKKRGCLKEGRLVDDSVYDTLLFRRIQRNLFGGQLRLIFSDNGESTPDLASFLRTVLGTQVLNVFNLNETSSTVALSMFYDYNADPEAFGAPLPCNEVKLVDSQEKNMFANDSPNPRGEIWVRGNNVFAGYWNSKAPTDEEEGWFNTGRTGEFLPNRTLKVHPRS